MNFDLQETLICKEALRTLVGPIEAANQQETCTQDMAST